MYHANRPPTLNELHRGFRVGNVVDQSQSAARSRDAHRRRGRRPRVVDQGLGPRHRVLQRSRRRDLQHHAVEHADADHARAAATPTRFAPTASSSKPTRGCTPTFSVNGQLAFTSSHYRGSVATPAIEGNHVPQVPEIQGGVGADLDGSAHRHRRRAGALQRRAVRRRPEPVRAGGVSASWTCR